MNKGKYLTTMIVLALWAAGGSQLARAQIAGELPQGFTCGLSNIYSQVSVAHECIETAFYCGARGTSIDLPVVCSSNMYAHPVEHFLPGFMTFADGDGGDGTGFGYYHFAWNQSNTTPSDQYQLPQGTVCGFKEAKFDPSATCLGFDANVSCPPGWTQKFRNDAGAPSGGRFVWCEYQDPNHLCTTSLCYHWYAPTGTVCGASDSQKTPANGGGTCMGLSPSQSNCASLGYSYFSWDTNAPTGQGLAYCANHS